MGPLRFLSSFYYINYPLEGIFFKLIISIFAQINNYAKNVTTNNNLSFNETEIIEQVLAQYTEKFNKLSNKKITYIAVIVSKEAMIFAVTNFVFP